MNQQNKKAALDGSDREAAEELQAVQLTSMRILSYIHKRGNEKKVIRFA